jgi:hypothetical protein
MYRTSKRALISEMSARLRTAQLYRGTSTATVLDACSWNSRVLARTGTAVQYMDLQIRM